MSQVFAYVVEYDFDRCGEDGWHLEQQLERYRASEHGGEYAIRYLLDFSRGPLAGKAIMLQGPLTHILAWPGKQRNVQDVWQGLARANAYNT